MLVGTKGFLRTDEVLNLKVEDSPQEYFAVTQNNVEGLCMTVQGKTDQEILLYGMIRNVRTCPHLVLS